MQQLDWSLRFPEGARLESGYNRPISIRYPDGTLVHYTPKALTRQDQFEPLAKLFWQAQAKRAL